MPHREPTVRSRELGDGLRQAMEQAGLTGKYARALIRETGNAPPGEVEDRVAARLARQSLLSRERPARFTFYLHEYALRLPVGGAAVMAEQLEHLVRMVRHEAPRCIPDSVGRTWRNVPGSDG